MQFIIGNVYVDDETKAVYVLKVDPYKDNWLDFDQINIPLVSSCYSLSLIDMCIYKLVDNPDFNVHNNSDQFVKEKDANVKFRPWQASDEPDAYDAERWEKIETGKFYVRQGSFSKAMTFLFLAYVRNEAASYVQYRPWCLKIEDQVNDKFHTFDHFKNDITRPAFPNEIEVLKLPQMQGAIL